MGKLRVILILVILLGKINTQAQFVQATVTFNSNSLTNDFVVPYNVASSNWPSVAPPAIFTKTFVLTGSNPDPIVNFSWVNGGGGLWVENSRNQVMSWTTRWPAGTYTMRFWNMGIHTSPLLKDPQSYNWVVDTVRITTNQGQLGQPAGASATWRTKRQIPQGQGLLPQQQQQTPQQQWGQMQQHGRISGRGTTVILRRRFNPKSGKVELIKNGVISRIGYLNLIGKNLNRRQSLRNYRFR